MRALGWFLAVLGLLPVGCNADIVATCVDAEGASTCSSSSQGDKVCSCEGYEVECRKVKANDYDDYDYKWYRSGGNCSSPGTAGNGGSGQAGQASAGSPAAGGSAGTSGNGSGLSSITLREGLKSLNDSFAPGLSTDPHGIEQVIGFAAALAAAPLRLGLTPDLDLPVQSYMRPCPMSDGNRASACVQGYWTFDYNFTVPEPNGATSYELEAIATSEERIRLQAIYDPTQESMRYVGFARDSRNSFYLEFTAKCPGSGFVIDQLSLASVDYNPPMPLACD